MASAINRSVVERPHVVIVGGGFGGLRAAKALRHAPVRVDVFDRRNHHLFQPLLYQVATAALSPGDIASPIRWILSRQSNVRVLMGEVRGVDLARRTVSFEGEDVGYDYLILATGVTHAYFGHPEWAAIAPGLKTLDDALEIRRRVLKAFEAAERERDPDAQRRLLTFAIVGGGPTGVELAGALAEIAHHSLAHNFRAIDPDSTRIILIEAGPTILPSFPRRLRSAARDSLRKLRVEVREGTTVTAIDAAGVSLGEERIDAATVLWAAGVAASPLGASLGVPLDPARRVIVQRDLTVSGHPEVFVIGDLATCADEKGQPLPGVAQVAIQGGAHAALNIMRAIRGARLQRFRYVDYGSMATIGRGAAIADFGWMRLSGFPAWLAWLFVHIMMLVGFRNRLAVFFEWGWAYLSYQRSVRLITGK